MTRLILILTASSFLIVSCQSVPRPDADVCVANALALHQKCYNLHDDFDDAGQLKPDAKAHYRPCDGDARCYAPTTAYKNEAEMLAAIHKSTVIDPDSWAEIKAWVNELRLENARKGD